MNEGTGSYGIRFEYSTPARFITIKNLTGLSFDRQQRIYEAWIKAKKIFDKRYIGRTAFYITTFYGAKRLTTTY